MMASHRKSRKRPLPPWLQGVMVTTAKVPACNSSASDNDAEKYADCETSKNASGDAQGLSKNTTSLTEISESGDTSHNCKKSNETMKDKCAKSSNERKDLSKVTGAKIDRTLIEAGKSKKMTETENMSVEQIVELSYEEYIFKGSIVYSYNQNDCNIICEDIISEIDAEKGCHVGFDTEWPVTYNKGRQAKTALVQVCSSLNKCYLFHVSCMPKFPVMLKKLIEMKTVVKVGLNVEYDLWKLEADYDVRVKEVVQNSTVELRTLANRKLRSAENWSLDGLVKNALKKRISKDESICKCDWAQFPLPREQQIYAATDAVVSLMLYQHLSSL